MRVIHMTGTIREEQMGPHFTKFHLDGLPFPAVLHRFTRPDMGDPHDHPWGFRSFVLHGGYVEQVYAMDGSSRELRRVQGDSFEVCAKHIHRIVDILGSECWTLIQPGPPEQVSSFYQWREDGMYSRYWHELEFTRTWDAAA